MTIYRVWDEYNADESGAKEYCENNPYDAAIAFAKADKDGLTDGLYLLNGRELSNLTDGQPISVRAPDGTLHQFKVGVVEFTPLWMAVEVP